jgi:hypothetical protein
MNCCGLPYHLYTKTFPANFNVGGVNHSFIVVAPQFKQRGSGADVQSVIDYAKRRFRVDETRVYVTGLSLGGGSTWDWSVDYGQNAAAIVPVCGGTAPNTTIAQKIAAKNLPIWGFYSTIDEHIPEQWGYDFFKWIDQYNTTYASKTKLTMWTDVNHNATWGRAFKPATVIDGYNMYSWMLLHKRGTTTTPAPAPPPPTTPPPTGTNTAPMAKTEEDYNLPAALKYFPDLNGTLSRDSDGTITRYQWTQLEGPTVTITPTTTGRAKVTNWPGPGKYVFRLTVTDDKGATASDGIVVSLSASPLKTTNLAPMAKTENDFMVPASKNTFPDLNGTESRDWDGWITKYEWKKLQGPACTLTTTNVGISKVSNWGGKGIYLFQLSVTDNKGVVKTDNIKVTIY